MPKSPRVIGSVIRLLEDVQGRGHRIADVVDAFVTDNHAASRFAFDVRHLGVFKVGAGMLVEERAGRQIDKMANLKLSDVDLDSQDFSSKVSRRLAPSGICPAGFF